MSTALRFLPPLLLIVHISGMPDSMCFVDDIDPIFPYSARTVLDTTQQVTKRACEVACADNELCKGVSFSEPNCKFIGDIVANVNCSGFNAATKIVSVKKETSCPDRTEVAKDFGTDPCAEKLFPEATRREAEGICPREYIIRGINETGTRITIDNDSNNILYYDTIRKLWKVYYPPLDHTYWLAAVSCAIPISTYNCGCDPLYPMDAGRYPAAEGGSKAFVGPDRVCENPNDELMYWRFKTPPSQLEESYLSPQDGANMHIVCQAGIWLLTTNDNSDGWQITNATCIAITAV